MDWQLIDNKLYKKFKFNDFKSAISFMAKSAEAVDKINHHPEWKNVYNTVEVWLCTHDAGNVVTDKDRTLSQLLDKIYDSE